MLKTRIEMVLGQERVSARVTRVSSLSVQCISHHTRSPIYSCKRVLCTHMLLEIAQHYAQFTLAGFSILFYIYTVEVEGLQSLDLLRLEIRKRLLKIITN